MHVCVLICVELSNYEKLMSCRLNMKIERVLEKIHGLELKIMMDDMIEGRMTKIWPQTVKKTELKRKSYDKNKFWKKS